MKSKEVTYLKNTVLHKLWNSYFLYSSTDFKNQHFIRKLVKIENIWKWNIFSIFKDKKVRPMTSFEPELLASVSGRLRNCFQADFTASLSILRVSPERWGWGWGWRVLFTQSNLTWYLVQCTNYLFKMEDKLCQADFFLFWTSFLMKC